MAPLNTGIVGAKKYEVFKAALDKYLTPVNPTNSLNPLTRSNRIVGLVFEWDRRKGRERRTYEEG